MANHHDSSGFGIRTPNSMGMPNFLSTSGNISSCAHEQTCAELTEAIEYVRRQYAFGSEYSYLEAVFRCAKLLSSTECVRDSQKATLEVYSRLDEYLDCHKFGTGNSFGMSAERELVRDIQAEVRKLRLGH
jgi:hypothetical protein